MCKLFWKKKCYTDTKVKYYFAISSFFWEWRISLCIRDSSFLSPMLSWAIRECTLLLACLRACLIPQEEDMRECVVVILNESLHRSHLALGTSYLFVFSFLCVCFGLVAQLWLAWLWCAMLLSRAWLGSNRSRGGSVWILHSEQRWK